MELEKYLGHPGEQIRTSDVEIDYSKENLIGTGIQEGEVFRVDSYLQGVKNRHRLSLAEKRFYNSDLTGDLGIPENIFQILEKQKKLKELGLPVVPTLRWSPQKPDSLFMTDLTLDGKCEVISSNDFDKSLEKIYKIKNIAEISVELNRVFIVLLDHGLVLNHYDVFFLQIDKNTNNARLYMVDLAMVDFPDTNTKQDNKEKLEKNLIGMFNSYVRAINLFLDKESQIRAEF